MHTNLRRTRRIIGCAKLNGPWINKLIISLINPRKLWSISMQIYLRVNEGKGAWLLIEIQW